MSETTPNETLEQKVDKLTATVEARFDSVDKRFDAVDKRFEAVDKQFEEVTEALVEQREYTEYAFDRLRTEINAGSRQIRGDISRLERKLDRVLDTRTRTKSPRRRR